MNATQRASHEIGSILRDLDHALLGHTSTASAAMTALDREASNRDLPDSRVWTLDLAIEWIDQRAQRLDLLHDRGSFALAKASILFEDLIDRPSVDGAAKAAKALRVARRSLALLHRTGRGIDDLIESLDMTDPTVAVLVESEDL